jgi:hypothetical protein
LFLVEIPVRRRMVLPSRCQIFTFAAIGLASLFAFGAWLSSSSGLQWRYPVEARALLEFAEEPLEGWHYGKCFITPEEPNFSAGPCLRTDPRRPNVLLLGDSRAAHLRSGIEQAYPDINLLQANASGCRPVLGGLGQPHCTKLREFVFGEFLPRHRVEAILVSANWFDDESDVPRIAATATYLRRFAPVVVILGPTPLFDRPAPDLLAFDVKFGTILVARHLMRSIVRLDEKMEALARSEGWTYISGYKTLCRHECTLYAAPGTPLYRDETHFTVAGSRLFAERALGPALAPDGTASQPAR